MISAIWEFARKDPEYRYLITSDHGKGTNPLDSWKYPGDRVGNAGDVWFVAFGDVIKHSGEVKLEEQFYNTILSHQYWPSCNSMTPPERCRVSPSNGRSEPVTKT